jgi:hypothetical protein
MITSPKRGQEYNLPDEYQFCEWCDSPYDPTTKSVGTTWCSDVCRLVIKEGRWPSPVGPATHAQMLKWIKAQEKLDAEQAARATDD